MMESGPLRDRNGNSSAQSTRSWLAIIKDLKNHGVKRDGGQDFVGKNDVLAYINESKNYKEAIVGTPIMLEEV